MRSDGQQGYDYLPVLPNGHQAATDCSGFIEQPSHVEIARASSQHRPHLVTGSDLLSTSQDGISYGLLSPSGHACFEVWIAMELCDGGTLAQQVSQGFQYCPATRQVDMVSSGDALAGGSEATHVCNNFLVMPLYETISMCHQWSLRSCAALIVAMT